MLSAVQTAGQREQLLSIPSGLSHSLLRAQNEAIVIQYRGEHDQGPCLKDKGTLDTSRFITGWAVHLYTDGFVWGTHGHVLSRSSSLLVPMTFAPSSCSSRKSNCQFTIHPFFHGAMDLGYNEAYV